MAITYGGIGTTATGVNASVAPTLPPTPTAGDLMLLGASIRNSGAGSPDTPAGWVVVADLGNAKLFGRFYQPGDVAPVVTFTGGVANADTQAAIIKLVGVAPNQLTEREIATLVNATAQNINYPALDVPGNGHAVLIFAWKQDDATTIALPGGFTGAINSSVTAGDDAYLRLGYSIQTTEADISAGALTVTGGGTAISKAAVISFMPASTFAVTIQDQVFPPRAVLAVSGLVGNESLELYRVVAGARTLVRGGSVVNPASGTAYVTIDAELPFGVPVSWLAVVNGAEYASQTETINPPGGKVLMTDAISGLAAEVVVVSWPSKNFARRVSVFQLANGDTKTISGPRAMFTSQMDVLIETDAAHASLQTLLENATSNVIQLRQPGGYSYVDCYLTVIEFSENRASQDGTDQRRTFTLQVAEVNGWNTAFETAGYTYADLTALYAGLTYADLAGDYGSYLALAIAELEP